jgi:cation:H+ antiporter
MQRFLMLVAVAVLAAIPALALRLTGAKIGPIGETAAYGVAILSAGFLLSWGAEAAERHVSQGLIIAVVALVTVLPEYAVDLYYAFQAGKAGPESQYVHYAAANMTGANRLLVGLGWPLLVVMHWARGGGRAVELSRGNAVEIAFLLLASLYAFVIVLKNSITLLDFAVLAAIFGVYVWRVHGAPGVDKDEDEEPGPAAAMNTLPVRTQWAVMAGLTLAACVIILASAEPFAEGMVRSGRLLGLNEFLLIQWLAPLASEAPAVTVAVLFVLAGRAANGLGALVSDKINQWTLLVGMLPLALSLGAGTVAALPLDARYQATFGTGPWASRKTGPLSMSDCW